MILGHVLEGSGLDSTLRDLIYSFHMPFFFFVSGFLFYKKYHNYIDYTISNVKSLLIPYVFFRLCTFLLLVPYFIFKRSDVSNFPYAFINGTTDFPGGANWFLLCFFCVKELYYWIDTMSVYYKWPVVIIMGVLAYFIHIRLFWNLDAALMAMPFFMIGVQYKDFILKAINAKLKLNVLLETALLLSTIILFFMLSKYQGNVGLYDTTFGDAPLLFYPCAFIGIGIVLYFSKIVRSNQHIETFSKGTIVIMGLHGALYPYLMLLYRVLFRSRMNDSMNVICEMLISLLILLILYYPIIWMQKYVPFLIGNRK